MKTNTIMYVTAMAFVLVISIFALANVSAAKGGGMMQGKGIDNLNQENRQNFKNMPQNMGQGRAMFADEISTNLNETDIEDSNSEISQGNLKKIGFPTVIKGNGWATSGQNGSLISFMLVKQEFVNNTDSSNYTIERDLGRIMISQNIQYKLVLTSSDNNSMDFDIVPMNKKVDFSNPTQNSIGTLNLDLKSSYNNLNVWSGTLNTNQTSMDITLATDSSILKSKSGPNQLNGNGQKIGFWRKLMFWKKN